MCKYADIEEGLLENRQVLSCLFLVLNVYENLKKKTEEKKKKKKKQRESNEKPGEIPKLVCYVEAFLKIPYHTCVFEGLLSPIAEKWTMDFSVHLKMVYMCARKSSSLGHFPPLALNQF